MLRSASAISSAIALAGLPAAAALTIIASRDGTCGNSDFLVSCLGFAAIIAVYGMACANITATVGTLIALALRRRVSFLLQACGLLTAAAAGVFALRPTTLSRTLGGAILAWLPTLLVGAGASCLLTWAGRTLSKVIGPAGNESIRR